MVEGLDEPVAAISKTVKGMSTYQVTNKRADQRSSEVHHDGPVHQRIQSF